MPTEPVPAEPVPAGSMPAAGVVRPLPVTPDRSAFLEPQAGGGKGGSDYDYMRDMQQAITDRDAAMANVGDVLAEELKGFDGLTPQQIKKRRADRFYAIGAL